MKPDKTEKIGIVSYMIVKELTKVSRSRINIQQLALKAGVSRPWIYKYFGSSEEEMVLTAIDCLSPQITELSKDEITPRSKKEWAIHFLKGLDITLQEAEEFPDFFQFYFMSIIFPNAYTERLKHHEHLYQEQKVVPKLRQVFGFGQSEARTFAEMILSLRFGLVLSWLNEPNKTKSARHKMIASVRKNIFDQFKEQD